MVSSCIGILDFPFRHDIGTEITAYESWRVHPIILYDSNNRQIRESHGRDFYIFAFFAA